MPNNKQQLAAGILCHAKDSKKYLILKRSSDSPEPGTWCGAGGKYEPKDNSLKETALREFREETGYKGDIKIAPLYTFENKGLKFENYLGLVENQFEPNLDKSENTHHKWVTKDELINHPNKHFGLKKITDMVR